MLDIVSDGFKAAKDKLQGKAINGRKYKKHK